MILSRKVAIVSTSDFRLGTTQCDVAVCNDLYFLTLGTVSYHLK